MERAEVIVQEPLSRDGQVRIGTVLSREGMTYRVRWNDDGEEEDIRYGSRYRLAVRGTLRYQSLVDPEPITALFEADRIGFILRVLRESGMPLGAMTVKWQLVELGLDPKAVDAAWAAAQKTFKESADVKVIPKSKSVTGPKYQWIGPAVEPPEDAPTAAGTDDARTEHPTEEPSGETPTAHAPAVEPTDGIAAVEPADGIAAVEPADVVSAAEPEDVVEENASDDTQTADDGAPPAPAAVMTLADAFGMAVGDKVPRSLAGYAATPLRTGVRCGRLGDSAIAELLATLTDQDRVLAEVLMVAVPRRVDALDSPEPAPPFEAAAVDAVLAAAVAELDDQSGPNRAAQAAAAWLVRRVSARGSLNPSAAVPLISIAEYLAAGHHETVAEALELVARSLTRLLPQLAPDARESLNLDRLTGAVARLPLQADGTRAALMAAIGRIRPAILAEEMWWGDASLEDLACCAHGVLGAVTSMPSVVERIIKPRVVKEFSAVATRTRLSFLLGLPREFVAAVPADAVAGAFRRAAGEDMVVRGWVAALSDDERAEALERDLELARGEAVAATGSAEAMERRAEELAERCERLEEVLRREHAESVALRASHERQLQIDVVRALADLAAEVEELAITHAEPDVLVDRVRALVAGQALEPVGTAGGETPYDPALHNPVVGEPEVGSAVTVIRPGYRWYASGEEILIHKALVSGT